MTSNKRDENAQSPKESATGGNRNNPRRSFLQAALTFSLVLVTAAVAGVAKSLWLPSSPPPSAGNTSVSTSRSASSGFPRIKVANISDLTLDKPLSFNYPLEETPNMLAKLGVKANAGVGPDGDIVAYSQVCQHLGCIWGYVGSGTSPGCNDSYKASSPVGYCCCHGSEFDLTNGAKVLGGPSPRPQPQVILELDSSTGDIYATGMTPPSIFGHKTGSSDVSADLQGGTLVS